MGVGGQRPDPADLPPGKRPGAHCSKIQRQEINIIFGMAVRAYVTVY